MTASQMLVMRGRRASRTCSWPHKSLLCTSRCVGRPLVWCGLLPLHTLGSHGVDAGHGRVDWGVCACKSGRCVAAGIMETRQHKLAVAVLGLAVPSLAVLMDGECMEQDMHREMRIACSDRADQTVVRAHSSAGIL
jgi:hypothetical protein